MKKRTSSRFSFQILLPGNTQFLSEKLSIIASVRASYINIGKFLPRDLSVLHLNTVSSLFKKTVILAQFNGNNY